MAKKPDYITCKNCTHTENTHHDLYPGECRGYLCECDHFEAS